MNTHPAADRDRGSAARSGRRFLHAEAGRGLGGFSYFLDVALLARPLRRGDREGGPEAVLGLWKTFFEIFDRATVSPDEFIECGDHVVVPNRTYLRGRDRVTVEAQSALVATIRNGRIVEWRLYQVTAEAFEAVGLSEQDAHT